MEEKVTMTAASSISFSGRLWNMTSSFSEDEFFIGDEPSAVSFLIEPASIDLVPGNYTLTVGARYGTITVSKVIQLEVRA